MSPKTRIWIGRVISVLVCLPFIPSAIFKLTGAPQVVEGMTKFGFPPSILTPLGILELFCVIVYLVPPTAVLGAILLAGYLGGAIVTHWRAGEAFPVQVILGLLVWLGIYLREPRLWPVLPIRRDLKRH